MLEDIIHVKHLPIKELKKHPRNYRTHPESQLAKLRASILRFGQVKPVVVFDDGDGYVIIAGHGFTHAADQLGCSHVGAVIVPQTWTASDVTAFLITDNETSNGAQINELMLAELLEESKNAGYDLAALGSSETELAALLERLTEEQLKTEPLPSLDLDEIADDENPLDAKGITCPNCGHVF